MSKSIQWLILIGVGGLAGLFLGDLLSDLITEGVLHDVFAKSIDFGIDPPGTLDLKFFTLTFGLRLHLNLLGLVGIGVGIYLRKYL